MANKIVPVTPSSALRLETPPTVNPEILGPDDVARLLGVDTTYVFEKTRSRCANPLPSHSLGRYLRFFKHEVLAWLAAQPSDRPKRKYRLSPAARKRLQQRNRERSGDTMRKAVA
jgi:hypothetical protein